MQKKKKIKKSEKAEPRNREKAKKYMRNLHSNKTN